MKQQNRVFMDFSKCKMKETFCTLFYALYTLFLCTLPVTYFGPFLREKCFFQVKIECLGQTATILRTCRSMEKAL